MKNISQDKLLKISSILPPLDLQRVFVGRVGAIKKMMRVHTESLSEFDALFASLQHGAFRGRL